MNYIETLVVTINKKDDNLHTQMNINSDSIIANQSDEVYDKTIQDGVNKIRYIGTKTKGVGVNRNIALLYSSRDICLLSDDDVVYNDDYALNVEKAFKKLAKADIIIFNIDTINGINMRRKNTKIRRVRLFNFSNYGAVRIAFRREKIIKKNLWFSLLFGGGTKYSSGEDSLFLRNALKNNLKVYTYPYSLGVVDQSTSSWFDGYSEKFFIDKGALISAMFPILSSLFAFLYAFRYNHISKKGYFYILKCLFKGIRDFY